MPQQDSPPALGRRSLLRTTAQAAWVVPAVSVVTAAPAFANSKIDDLTNAVVNVQRTPDGSSVRADVVATNDGPNWLATATVFLTMTISGGARFFTNQTANVQGKWQAWDKTMGLMRYRYMAEVPIGSGVYLGGYEAALWNNPPSGVIDVDLSYNGVLVTNRTLHWP